MGKSNTKCLLVYLAEPGPFDCTFNDEPCHARYDCDSVYTALIDQDIWVKRSLYLDGSILLRIKPHRDIAEELREALVVPWTPPGCRKRSYADEDSALLAIHRTVTSPRYWNPSGDPLVPYTCRHCGSWHIGHKHRNRPDQDFTS